MRLSLLILSLAIIATTALAAPAEQESDAKQSPSHNHSSHANNGSDDSTKVASEDYKPVEEEEKCEEDNDAADYVSEGITEAGPVDNNQEGSNAAEEDCEEEPSTSSDPTYDDSKEKPAVTVAPEDKEKVSEPTYDASKEKPDVHVAPEDNIKDKSYVDEAKKKDNDVSEDSYNSILDGKIDDISAATSRSVDMAACVFIALLSTVAWL